MTTSPTPFIAYSMAELAALRFPEHTWLIDDLIPTGSLTLLVGRPKAGKSLLVLDMLASVALGQSFAGRPAQRHLAIYGSAEDSLRLVRQRLVERLGASSDPALLVVPFDGAIDQWLRIDSPTSFGSLAATIIEHRAALVALDPLREIHGQPENDADAMAMVLRPLRQLAHETNCAIVVVHHRNKFGSDPSTAARGSSAIVGSVDQAITLDVPDSHVDVEGQAVPVRLFVEGRFGPRQRLIVQLGSRLRWELADPISAESDAGARILAALRQSATSLTAADVARVTRLADRTAMHHLARLYAHGQLERAGDGNRSSPYTYRLARRPSAKEPG